MYGFVVFIVGSALCGLAPTLPALDGFRVLQGVGAAMIQANSVAIVVLALPREKLGRGIGIQGQPKPSASPSDRPSGACSSPSAVGGSSSSSTSLLASSARHGLVPHPPQPPPPAARAFRLARAGAVRPCRAALLSAVSFGNSAGWTSPAIIGLFVAAVAGGAFVHRERRAASDARPHAIQEGPVCRRHRQWPALIPGPLRHLVRRPSTSSAALPRSPGRSGLMLGVMPIAFGVTAPSPAGWPSGSAPGRSPSRAWPLAAAMMGTLIVAHGSLVVIMVELAVLGIGLGMFTPPNNAAIMGSVPGTVGGGQWRAQHDPGLGNGHGPGFHQPRLRAVAGSEHAPVALVTRGFEASAAFLGTVALVALVLAGLRGKTGLDLDPVVSAE